MTSPHPKIAAILAVIVALGNAGKLLLDGDPNTNPDYATLAAVVIACYGVFSARQNNVTSEQAGAK